MRLYHFIIICLLLAVMGCNPQNDSPAKSQLHETPLGLGHTNPLPQTNVIVSLAGTWHWRSDKMLIELSPNGGWRWWNLEEQSGRPSEPPFMSGKWFIHEQALYLRIQHHSEGGGHGFGPGMAMVFELKSVEPEALHFTWFSSTEEVTWKRVATDSATNSGEPMPPLTNRTSQAGNPTRSP